MSISTIIVDDEKPARDELAFLLKGFPEINVIGQGKNGVEAMTLIKEHAPDLVFLDVQMPGLDGFGVLRKLVERKMKVPHVVFATAFDHYAVQAFDVNAVDYVLKPFDKARIAKAIQRARKVMETQTTTTERLEQLVTQLGARKQAAQPAKLLVKSQQRLLLVDAEDLFFASIDDGTDLRGGARRRRHLELPHARRIARGARLGIVLASASLVPGEHPPHQGSRPVVQGQLHAERWRTRSRPKSR